MIRWTLAIVAALLALAAAAVLVVSVINPDRYKGELEDVVHRATGRPFALDGPLKVTWFPWLGITTGPAHLGNPPGAVGADLIDWQSAQVKVRLLPLLLHRELEVARIRVRGAAVHLRRGPKGQGNWEDLLAWSHAGGGTAATPVPAIAGLALRDSSLDFTDEQTGYRIDLTNWQLSVGAWRPSQPLSVSTKFVLHGGSLPAAGVMIELAFRGMQVQASPLAISAPQVSVDIAGARLRGSAAVNQGSAGLEAAGVLTATVPSVHGLIRTLAIKARLPEDPRGLGALSLAGQWSYRGGTLALNPLRARLDATTVSGWIACSAGEQPLWTFALRADDIDFGLYKTASQVHKPLEPLLRKLEALHARGSLELGRVRFQGMTLKDLKLQVQ